MRLDNPGDLAQNLRSREWCKIRLFSNVFSNKAKGACSYAHFDSYAHFEYCRLGRPVSCGGDYIGGSLSVLRRIVAAGMLLALFGFGNTASVVRAECTTSGTVATCTGDLSDGVSETSSNVETLKANSLTINISPDSGTSGISLLGVGSTGDDGTDFLEQMAMTADREDLSR